MQRALRISKLVSLWLASATLAFAGVLTYELFRREQPGAVTDDLGYLLRLSLALTLTSSLPLAALHLVHAGAQALRGRGALGSSLLVLLGSAIPGWRIGGMLASGGRAAIEDEPTSFVQLGFTLAFAVGHVGLWLYHLAGANGFELDVAGRRRLLVYAGVGAVGVAVLVRLLSFDLSSYAYIAEGLVRPTWLLCASVLFAGLRSLELGGRTIAVGSSLLLALLGALSMAAAGTLEHTRGEYMRRGRMVALADLLVFPPDPARLGLTIADPSRIVCKVHKKPRRPTKLDLPMERRQNVILISIDAMRRDALDWKARGRRVMPAVAKLESQSVSHRRAVTTYPATLMGAGGALTGLDPSQLMLSPRAPDNVFTLTAHVFDRRLAVIPKSRWFSTKVVQSTLLRGAHVVRDSDAERQTARLIAALSAARRANERVLAWVHYYEPHREYYVHEGHDYGASPRERYMSELSYVDAQIGRLMSYLERARFFDDSLVVLFSDHGEALGERDYFGHHVYLNAWITDIPLMHRAPGSKPRRSTALSDVTDVAATVLHFAGVPKPWEMVGKSLLASEKQRAGRISIAEAFPIRGKPLFRMAKKPTTSWKALAARLNRLRQGGADYSPKVSAVTASHRLIVDRVTGLEELYDRVADPGEHNDLSHEQDFERRRLRQHIEAWSQAQAEKLYCRVAAERKAMSQIQAAQAAKKKSAAKKKKKAAAVAPAPAATPPPTAKPAPAASPAPAK